MSLNKILGVFEKKRIQRNQWMFVMGGQFCGGFEFVQSFKKSIDIVYSDFGKEADFFNTELYERKSIDAYMDSFKSRHRTKTLPKLMVDLSWNYSTDIQALKRLANFNQCKMFVFLKRNPIERFLLAYRYFSSSKTQYLVKKYPNNYSKTITDFLLKNDNLKFENFCEIELGPNPVFQALKLGDYQWQIDNILDQFGSESLLVMEYDQLFDISSFKANYLPKLQELLSVNIEFNVDSFTKYFVTRDFTDNLAKPEIVNYLKKYYNNF
jgi:hypothetical protein